MQRALMDQLVTWKNTARRKPLILNGARQVGKTWLLKEFGRLHFESVAYVSLDNDAGTVCPCMSMVDAEAESWLNAFETPLRDILGESPFMDRCAISVGMVRDGNDACRACEYIDRCNGGCRAGALMSSGNYLAPCPENCHFFFGGW